jgi:hypothetical protein
MSRGRGRGLIEYAVDDYLTHNKFELKNARYSTNIIVLGDIRYVHPNVTATFFGQLEKHL